jgi:hypothetical protein
MKNIFKIICVSLVFFSVKTNAQTLTALQMQNARATGYVIIAARNPGKSFSVYLVKWDGVHDLEYNANNQINPGWHPQAVVKGNFFDQTFPSNDFTLYSSVLVSQAAFDANKATGTDWWIVCSYLPSFSNSSLSISDNGNVGIGITAPAEKLDVMGNAKLSSYSPTLILQRDTDVGGYIQGIQTKLKDGSNNWYFGNLHAGSWIVSKGDYQNPKLTVLDNGNVGIGNGVPAERLDVTGNAKLSGYSPTLILQRDTDVGGYIQGIQTKLKDGSNNWYFGNLHAGSWMVSKGDYQNPKMTVLDNGNVGIGTTNPTSKLTVAGNINSREVKVTVDAGADFVFEKDYNLPSLASVDRYVKENKHLPEIASAKEMQENGINLSEMNIKLLQKVEELTLYSIEQQKKLDEQNKDIKAQNETMETQNNTLHNLQKLIETLAERLTRLERK